MLFSKKAMTVYFLLGIAGILAYWISDLRNYLAVLPEPANVHDISGFTGRILPANEVHAGTFSISVPASQINGENAILAYGRGYLNGGASCVMITYWKPDPKTPNVFQKGEKIKSDSEIWNRPFVQVGRVTSTGNTLTAYPKRHTDWFVLKSIIMILAATAFCIVMPISIEMTPEKLYRVDRHVAKK